MAYKIYDNVVGLRDATAEETIQIDAREKEWADNSESRKLAEIKAIREPKLKETDYFALSDTTLSVAMSDYRQSLRDIPQNNITEEQYDLLLARDENGQLTNEIWSKP